MKLKYLVALLVPLCVFFIFDSARAAKDDIYIVEIADAISPGIAEFIKNSIAKAEAEQAACIIIELDTPGGLAESMRLIIQDILGSKVPVVVYVSPPGARAASAGRASPHRGRTPRGGPPRKRSTRPVSRSPT